MTDPLTTLRQFILDHFSADDLLTLCFDLQINYDDLAGNQISSKTSNLLLRCGQERKFEMLLALLQRQRSAAYKEMGLGAYNAEALYAARATWAVESGDGVQGHHIAQAGDKGVAIVGDKNVVMHADGDFHYHVHTASAGKPLQRPPRADHFTDHKPEQAQKLRFAPYEALNQRIAVRFHLKPFDLQETIGYIKHHLRIAGLQNPIFSDAFLSAVHEHSKGVPRKINNICRNALLLGATENKKILDETDLKRVLLDFEGRLG